MFGTILRVSSFHSFKYWVLSSLYSFTLVGGFNYNCDKLNFIWPSTHFYFLSNSVPKHACLYHCYCWIILYMVAYQCKLYRLMSSFGVSNRGNTLSMVHFPEYSACIIQNLKTLLKLWPSFFSPKKKHFVKKATKQFALFLEAKIGKCFFGIEFLDTCLSVLVVTCSFMYSIK